MIQLRPGPIDTHAHIVPEGLLRRFEAGERAGFAVQRGADGVRVTLAGKPARVPLAPGMHDMAIRERAMAGQGVAAQVLSPWIALCDCSLGEADAAWLHSAVNQEIAAVVRAAPTLYAGLGTAPLHSPDLAVAMLHEAVTDLGLAGIEIATSVGPDIYLDDPSLDPVWQAAEALGAFIMVHPPLEPATGPFGAYYLNNLIQNPLQTTVAGARLILGGVLERFPRLRLCLVHGGGLLPYNLGRLRHGHVVRPEARARLQGSVEDSFRRLYFDSVTHSPSALAFLVGESAPGHVLLGTDYPFDMADPDPVRTVRDAGLCAEDEALILSTAVGTLL
jgi:aminocarboxymuconate-semialdehyde decarboxylase